jgi:hypothetical protein
MNFTQVYLPYVKKYKVPDYMRVDSINQILNNQKIRYKNRRKFKQTISKNIKKKNVIEKIFFDKNFHSTGEIIYSKNNSAALKSCKKSGVWLIIYILNKKLYFWTSFNIRYFRKFPNLSDTLNFSTIINKAEFISLNNVTVNSDSITGSLNIYDHKIYDGVSHNFINEALFLCVNGSGIFQHFVQDFLPILCQAKPFLNQNPEIPIIINRQNIKFMNHDLFFTILDIYNPVFYIQDSNISVEKLYMFDYQPINAIYSLPKELYANLFKEISNYKYASIIDQKNLVFFVRDEETRNILNIDLVKNELIKYAKLKNLNPIFLNPSHLTIKELIDTLSNAKYIFGVHGGAMYNSIFADKESVVIEFITAEATDSLLGMIRGFGLNYFPYALNFGKGDKQIEISKYDLDSILNSLDAFENSKVKYI